MRRALRVSLTALAALAVGVLVASSSTPSLIWVQKPSEGARIGIEGVEVLVRFPQQSRVATETFRVLVNGADVTAQLTTGANGASGLLAGLLEGENLLRFEVQGDRGGWPGHFGTEAREVRVLVRLPQGLDRG
ncbi:MAG: hypothetical protein ACREMG_10035 [Gemmatimonadales bacterium]